MLSKLVITDHIERRYLSDMYRIEKESFPDKDFRWPWNEFQSIWMTNQVWVALENGHPVGSILTWPERHDAHIAHISVDSRMRSQGIGSLLLKAAEDFYAKREYDYMTLNVLVDNPMAQMLYFKLGYRTFGFKKPSERKCWAIKMRKTLGTELCPLTPGAVHAAAH